MGGKVLSGGELPDDTPAAYEIAVAVLFKGELPDDYRWTDDGRVIYEEGEYADEQQEDEHPA